MPSIFKKIFGRKSKQGSLPLSDSGNSSSAILTSSKKDKKNKILSRKQKKQDKKAAFPSLPSKNTKSVPLASADRDNFTDRDLEKENSPGASAANHANDMGGARLPAKSVAARNSPVFDENQPMSYRKPTLSLIKEETSPKNENSFPQSEATPTTAASTGAKTPMNHLPQAATMLSPMSGSKPPLTPNRLGNRNSTVNLDRRVPHHNNPISSANTNITHQHIGRNEFSNIPSLLDIMPLSPENCPLRGVNHALSPASNASSNDMMCLSTDADDVEYNRIAFERVSNNRGGSHSVHSKDEQHLSALENSPYSYTPEKEKVTFPSLANVKDPFPSQDPHNMLPQPRLIGRHREEDFLPMAHETQDDIRAWTPSPTKKGTASFTFTPGDKLLSPSAISNVRVGGGEHPMPKGGNTSQNAYFGSFADFETFDPRERFSRNNKSTSSVSPISALLEDSRTRRSGRNVEGGVSSGSHQINQTGSSSINSAPIISPPYSSSQVQRSIQTASSISRVIDNLELHVNKRQGSYSGSINSHNVSTRDFVSEASSRDSRKSAESAIREAKERIRRENLMNNESKVIDILASGGSGAQAAAVMNAKNGDNNWLFDEVTGTLGPRSAAADLESLGGRSNKSGKSKNSNGNKSHRSHRSLKSQHGHRRQKSNRNDGDLSVESRTTNSRTSHRSYKSTRSMVSQMSEQSRSVANDLLRLEAQLSMVGKSRSSTNGGSVNSSVLTSELSKRRDDCGMTVTSRDFSMSRSSAGGLPRPKGSGNHISASARRAAARTMRSKVSVVAPPGKLGIILANRTDSRGTVVSGVRTSSVLAEQVSPGDRIIAIDEEDVSQMNVKEITTIMARKSEFERVLVLLAAPKHQYD